MELCPCGTGATFDECCGVFISGRALPPTPEKLMRSRYTAYTKNNLDYIANTMHGPAAERFEATAAQAWTDHVQWLKLDVLETSVNGDIGFVEFLAHFRENNKRHVMHELSEFHCENGAWYYYDGKTPQHKAPVRIVTKGRNDPCGCGSGKKFKKCCGHLV